MKSSMPKGISIGEIQKILTDDLKVLHDFCEEHEIRYCLAYGTLLGAIRHKGCIPWDDDVDVMMPRRDYLKFLSLAPQYFNKDYFIQTPESDRYYNLLHIPLKVRSKRATLIEEPGKKYYQGSFIDIFPFDYMGDDQAAFLALKKKCALMSSLKMRISLHELSGIKRYVRIAMQLVCKLIPAKAIYRWEMKQVQKVVDNDRAVNRDMMAGLELVTHEKMNEEDLFPLELHPFGSYEFYVPHHFKRILTDLYGDYMTPPSEEEIAHSLHGIFYSDQPYDLYKDVDFKRPDAG
ncbi:LicD family protein [[Clostridium] leptum]|nr:LicD family protein [[Clostridium] leptum]